MDPQTCSIDALGPFPIARPSSVGELGDVVRGAPALFPLGGRTMLGIGLPPSRPGIGVDLTALNRVIDYPARDMTITVEAGITMQQLRELLAKEGQRLPVDVPLPDRATLGGALAANTSGPRRFGYGTFRDYVIGISVINDQGQETKAGGRVVKNVAGYDLCKLHVGALGTLGIISQATLKLRPIPEENALVVVRCEASELESVLTALHGSRTRPVVVDVLNPRAAREMPPDLARRSPPETAWAVIAGFEESIDAVHWQVQHLLKELSPLRTLGMDTFASAAAEPVWRFLSEFRLRPSAMLSFKANLLPHAVAGFCRLADGLDEILLLQAHAGNGIVVGHSAGSMTVERAGTILRQLQESAASAEGNVVILQCPPAWKAVLPVWGRPRGDAFLMSAVREKLDPRRLFNPGRFLV